MTNLNAPLLGKGYTRRMLGAATSKWSGRRTVGFALLASAALWMLIFAVARILVV